MVRNAREGLVIPRPDINSLLSTFMAPNNQSPYPFIDQQVNDKTAGLGQVVFNLRVSLLVERVYSVGCASVVGEFGLQVCLAFIIELVHRL